MNDVRLEWAKYQAYKKAHMPEILRRHMSISWDKQKQCVKCTRKDSTMEEHAEG